MRLNSSPTTWLLPLLLLTATPITAMNNAILRKLNDLAEQGLDADGNALQSSSSSEEMTLFSTPSKTFVQEPPIPSEYVKLPLNHFSKSKDWGYDGVFYNRFWVRESAYKRGGPVFVYDVGEADASGNAQFRLTGEGSFFRELVDEFGGVGVVWEHRFYGNSTPEPILTTTPPEAFKYLTTEQSLADLDYFARHFQRKNISYDLRPHKTPWILVGGSYPGMRAAFMRAKYPETIFAGFASSAPTEAKIDMTSYFDPIFRGMNAYGFGNCSRDIQASVRWVDQMLEREKSAKMVKELFLGLGGAENSHASFAEALGVIFYAWQSYGMEGSSWGLRYLCDWISTDPATNKTSPARGWAAAKGGEWSARRWATWPNWNDVVNSYMNADCSGSLSRKGPDCNLDKRWTDPATIAWTWQYCTQWGYFQAANVGPNQLLSRHNSLLHQKYLCHRQFPTATFRDHGFPDWPDVARTNREFGGWDLRPSHVYWSAGEFDPWRTLGPLSGEVWGPRVRASVRDVPRCYERQGRGELFGYVIKGAQHCYDFRSKSVFPGGEVSRGYFVGALERWLRCFRPRDRERGWWD